MAHSQAGAAHHLPCEENLTLRLFDWVRCAGDFISRCLACKHHAQFPCVGCVANPWQHHVHDKVNAVCDLLFIAIFQALSQALVMAYQHA